jgi:hypothetical protein
MGRYGVKAILVPHGTCPATSQSLCRLRYCGSETELGIEELIGVCVCVCVTETHTYRQHGDCIRTHPAVLDPVAPPGTNITICKSGPVERTEISPNHGNSFCF